MGEGRIKVEDGMGLQYHEMKMRTLKREVIIIYSLI